MARSGTLTTVVSCLFSVVGSKAKRMLLPKSKSKLKSSEIDSNIGSSIGDISTTPIIRASSPTTSSLSTSSLASTSSTSSYRSWPADDPRWVSHFARQNELYHPLDPLYVEPPEPLPPPPPSARLVTPAHHYFPPTPPKSSKSSSCGRRRAFSKSSSKSLSKKSRKLEVERSRPSLSVRTMRMSSRDREGRLIEGGPVWSEHVGSRGRQRYLLGLAGRK